MAWLNSILFRLMCAFEWREIETAPFDHQLELAVIGGDIGVLHFCGIRRGNGWLNAETMESVDIAATHWRFRRPDFLPMSCC
jgi:hypothetical protein